ncbi:MAG: hypothetical protein ABGZ35_19525, partial [Planctomycetaceae bacterium]
FFGCAKRAMLNLAGFGVAYPRGPLSRRSPGFLHFGSSLASVFWLTVQYIFANVKVRTNFIARWKS